MKGIGILARTQTNNLPLVENMFLKKCVPRELTELPLPGNRIFESMILSLRVGYVSSLERI